MIELRVRRNAMRRGARQGLEDVRWSSRFAQVADRVLLEQDDGTWNEVKQRDAGVAGEPIHTVYLQPGSSGPSLDIVPPAPGSGTLDGDKVLQLLREVMR